jgi:small subunit ribosomal protein S17
MPSKKKAAEGKKNIGVTINPPEKDCKDPRCAWHGSLPVRGRIFKGEVRSSKSHNTVIVEWGYNRFIRKYERYQRQKSRVTAHNPPCMKAREGDLVVVAECRPISKTKHFVVVGFQKDSRAGKERRHNIVPKKEKANV